MKVKITHVGRPFYYEGKIGFNVAVEFGEIHTSAFVKPGDDLNLAVANAVNEAIQDKVEEEGAGRFSRAVKKLIGTEIEVP